MVPEGWESIVTADSGNKEEAQLRAHVLNHTYKHREGGWGRERDNEE